MVKALRLNINRKCNLDCNYCYIDLSGERMDANLFKDLIDIHKPKQISLSGGEPFLHAQLAEFIEYAVGKGVSKVNIVTNGTYLKKIAERFRSIGELVISAGVHASLSISIDAVQKRQSSLGPVLAEYRRFGFIIRAYVYPDVENLADVISASRSVFHLFDECQILFPVPLGMNEGHQLSKSTWRSAWKALHEVWSEANIPIIVQRGFSDEPFLENHTIPANSDSMFLDYDGRASECCLLSEIERKGLVPHGSRCNVVKGEGCLAIKALTGTDWRFSEDDTTPPCPLWGEFVS